MDLYGMGQRPLRALPSPNSLPCWINRCCGGKRGLAVVTKFTNCCVNLRHTPFPAQPAAVSVVQQPLIDSLTNRELEVLQLIAKGLSNQQIADKLIISKGTVKYYTSHIYSKLYIVTSVTSIM